MVGGLGRPPRCAPNSSPRSARRRGRPGRAAGVGGESDAQPGQQIRDIPWQQKVLVPDRIRPFATGAGQVVAVIDTGIDGSHPSYADMYLPASTCCATSPTSTTMSTSPRPATT